MGEVIHLRPQPDDREITAFEGFRTALEVAQHSGRLVDMRVAVEAYDRWLAVQVQVENERGRR